MKMKFWLTAIFLIISFSVFGQNGNCNENDNKCLMNLN